MKNLNQLGRELSRKEMSMISGGTWIYTVGGKITGTDKIKGETDYYQVCQNLRFTMQNSQYVLNPDGSDPYMDLWKKYDCDSNSFMP
jgi:hypothetical protein